jgi:hypothetical protein
MEFHSMPVTTKKQEKRTYKAMDENQKEKDRNLKNFIAHFVIPFFLFLLSVTGLIFEVCYELKHRSMAEQAIREAQTQAQSLQEQIEEAEREEALLKQQFITDTGFQSSIIFCFDEFEDGAYTPLIELMDSYGCAGVIVFRDDNLPGMKGAISTELYEELLAKGWEGAIATSKDSAVCENMGETPKKKWKEYMQELKDYFESNGFAFPSTYIVRVDENISGVSDCMEEYGITNYVTFSRDMADAGVEMSNAEILNMGMVKGKYSYDADSLAEDLDVLTNNGCSAAIRIMKVESSAPMNNIYTSLYRIRTYLETISSNPQVMVTTFSGYRAYREALAETETEKTQTFLQEWELINKQIQDLKQENKENYRQATLKYSS